MISHTLSRFVLIVASTAVLVITIGSLRMGWIHVKSVIPDYKISVTLLLTVILLFMSILLTGFIMVYG